MNDCNLLIFSTDGYVCLGFFYLFLILNVLHMNIHSLLDKQDNLKIILQTLHDKGIIIHCLLLCETFLIDDLTRLVNIPGYSLISKNGKNTMRGGVGILIRNEINYRVHEDLSTFIEGEFEAVFAEIISGDKNVILGEIYRVPNTNQALSVERYDNILTKVKNENKNIIIGTDQNFDYLKINENEYIADLLNIFISAGLVPVITKPTRITHTSATLIDNIYTNLNTNKYFTSGIIECDVSDHLPAFLFNYIKERITSKKPQQFMARKLDATAYDKLKDRLSNTDWNILNNMDVNDGFSELYRIIENTLDTIAPSRTFTIPHKNIIRDPWVTKGILKSSRTLDKLHKKD